MSHIIVMIKYVKIEQFGSRMEQFGSCNRIQRLKNYGK